MSLFWARFKNFSGDTFRLDTRIYLHETSNPSDVDECVGAVVGKNPGSAKPSTITDDLQPISLYGDKLLPTVRNVVLKAYEQANREVPKNSYIQVFNLFYLCDPNLSDALNAFKSSSGPAFCESEEKNIPWTWYVWGGDFEELNIFKARFSSLKINNHFFYDNVAGKIALRPPQSTDFAKHTQGLRHAYVVPHISELVANG